MDDKKVQKDWFDTEDIDPEEFEDDEEEKVTEVKATEAKADDTEDAKTSTEDEDAEADDNAEDDEEEEEEDDEAAKKAAEAKKNSDFAEKRRAKEAQEREAKLKKEAKTQAELEVIKKNPYTEEPIEDEEDLKVYKLMKEIDDEGGDPIADLPKRIAKIERDKVKAETEKANKIKEEVADLRRAYPDVDMRALGNDQELLDLADEKQGRWTLTECYEYLTMKRAKAEAKKEEQKEDKSVKENAKKVTKVPSSNSNGGKKETSTDYMEMSDEEFLKLQKNNGDFF